MAKKNARHIMKTFLSNRDFYEKNLENLHLSDDDVLELRDLVLLINEEFFDASEFHPWVLKNILLAIVDFKTKSPEHIGIVADKSREELIEWVGIPGAFKYIDEIIADGMGPNINIKDIISAGQVLAKIDIYKRVNEFLENREGANK